MNLSCCWSCTWADLELHMACVGMSDPNTYMPLPPKAAPVPVPHIPDMGVLGLFWGLFWACPVLSTPYRGQNLT